MYFRLLTVLKMPATNIIKRMKTTIRAQRRFSSPLVLHFLCEIFFPFFSENCCFHLEIVDLTCGHWQLCSRVINCWYYLYSQITNAFGKNGKKICSRILNLLWGFRMTLLLLDVWRLKMTSSRLMPARKRSLKKGNTSIFTHLRSRKLLDSTTPHRHWTLAVQFIIFYFSSLSCFLRYSPLWDQLKFNLTETLDECSQKRIKTAHWAWIIIAINVADNFSQALCDSHKED